MKKTVIPSIISLLFACATTFTSRADNPTPYKLPTAHAEAVEASATFMENSFDAVRAFSPFASMDQTETIVKSDDTKGGIINELTEFASKYLGTRYRRGSSSPKGFDCSGFVGFVFRNFGINLSRSSASQYNEGEKVEKGDLRPGDLMFFSGSRGGKSRVGHVAMVVDVNPDGSCTFIHASSSQGVVYQKFPDGGYYSKRYIGAKRIIPADPKA
ncbi:MAG: C40 family peptidase [Duncaniella sp.]|nr:C40 family peptidase [Duncaniella sp.]